MFQMRRNDLIKASWTVKVEVIGAAHQVHGENKSHQAEIVIAVEMRDKNVVDSMEVRLKTHQLHLGAFATIDKKEAIFNFDQL